MEDEGGNRSVADEQQEAPPPAAAAALAEEHDAMEEEDVDEAEAAAVASAPSDDDDEGTGLASGLARMRAPSSSSEGEEGAPLSSSPPAASSVGATGAEFGKTRNRLLVLNMLEQPDQPLPMTESMMEFLLQDGVCELLLGFITQLPAEDEAAEAKAAAGEGEAGQGGGSGGIKARPEKGDELDEAAQLALARSFNAMCLLASEDPTDALGAFLARKAATIAAGLFQVFDSRARGSFHHACRVLDYLLRFHTEAVLHTVGKSKGAAKRFLGGMVRCLAHAPVAETFMKIVFVPILPHGGGGLQYRAPPAAKWRLYESLAEWRLLVVLAREVYGPESTAAQASAAADVLLEVVDRLCTDDYGELLLQPLAHCADDLLDGLVRRALDREAPGAQRGECLRVLVAVAARSGEPTVPAPGGMGGMGGFPGMMPATVANQFCSVRPLVQTRLGSHLPALCETLLAAAQQPSGPSVEHPGHVVSAPFSYVRLQLVTLLVEVVGAEDSKRRLAKLPLPLWRALCQWFFQYPHANLYHNLFYRLVYQTLRAAEPPVQQLLFGKCRLVTALVDAFAKGDPAAGNRGHVLILCNALRLQAGTENPKTGWLRNFLKSHDTWRRVLGPLREATERAYLREGLGITVPNANSPFGGRGGGGGGGGQLELGPGLMYFAAAAEALGEGGGGGGEGGPGAFFMGGGHDAEAMAAAADHAAASIDYGSTLARSLGFEDDVFWEEEDGAGAQGGGGLAASAAAGGGGGSSGKKKKKKKKKGKKRRGSETDVSLASSAATEDEDEEDEQDEEEEDEEEEEWPRNGSR